MPNLDMTLDDMIKMNNTSRARPRTSGPGPNRRFRNRSGSRAAPYSFNTARVSETRWEHGAVAAGSSFPFRGGARVPAADTGTKLLISNLHHEVSDYDVKDIFSGAGDLKSYAVHCDRIGRSEGTAEVVFYRRQDAEAAIRRFNNVPLDGMPLKIEVVGTNTALPPHGRFFQDQRTGGAVRQPQGGARGVRKDHRGDGGPGENISAEELDADLEKYLAEAKKRN